MKKWSIILFLILVCLNFIQAQSNDYSIVIKQFNERDGLIARNSIDILKDEEGFIWIGTDAGLLRFDGYNFKLYDRDSNNEKIGTVLRLFQDDEGWLWLITNNDLEVHFFDPNTESIISPKERFGEDFPLNFAPDIPDNQFKKYDKLTHFENITGPDGTLYFWFSDPARIVTFHSSNGFQERLLPDFSFHKILFIDQGHNIWTTTENSIYKIDSTGQVQLSRKLKKNLYVENFSELDGQLYYYEINKSEEDNSFSIYRIKDDNHSVVRKIISSSEKLNNRIRGDQFWQLNDKGWFVSSWPELQPLFSILKEDYDKSLFELVQEVYRIGDNRTWVISRFGITKIDILPNRFTQFFAFSEKEQKPFTNSARGILVDGDYIYANFEFGGLVRFSKQAPNDWEILDQTPGLFNVTAHRFTGRPLIKYQGQLLSAHGDHLRIYPIKSDPFTYKSISFIEKEVSCNAIWTCQLDTSGKLWMGTDEGLAYKNAEEDSIRYLSIEGSLKPNYILQIVKNDVGQMWLCTMNGLFLFDPIQQKILAKYWTKGENQFQFPTNDILSFYEDKDGIRWVGTREGLIKWDSKTGEKTVFDQTNRFSNNTIYAIIEDQFGHLWISSDNGIIHFNKNTYETNSFLVKDGLSHYEFNRTSHYLDTLDGRIYFGSVNGINSFNPNDFYQDNKNTAPKLAITSFYQFENKVNKLVDRSGDLRSNNIITLEPNDRYFRLEFMLLSYNDNKQLKYAWKLAKGTQKENQEWNYQKENILQFGQLPYGKHTLYIKGQDSNGLWSPHELAITIVSLKPFYFQTWFIITLLLSGLLVIYLWYQQRANAFRVQQQLLESEIEKATKHIKKQAEELREMDQLKSRLYTNITHEFRTPLTVISGMTELVTKDPEKAKNLIQKNTQSLLKLVNQILDLTKLESGHLNPKYSQIDIIPFIQYLVESFQSYAQNKKINLISYLEEDQLLMDADEEILHSIISNLLSNAIKFTQKEGKIIFHLRKEEDTLIIKVKDNGLGIPEDKLPQIFDRFYQVDSSTTRKGEGTGIGLTLTKELIELLHGKIEVKSKLQQGTEFTILLPIQHNASIVTTPQILPNSSELQYDQQEIQTSSVRNDQVNQDLPILLLIEDNPDVATYVQSCLEESYQVKIAIDGEIGVQIALQDIPDIIISDVMMPKKDGFEVCQELKLDKRTSHIPIILLTARADIESKLEGLDAGADAYLPKPFLKEELLLRIRKLLELRQSLQIHYSNLSQTDHPNKVVSREQEFLQQVQKHIIEHLNHTDFGNAQLAQKMMLSESQLFRKLKALTGKSTAVYIRSIRLQKGKELLKNKELTIAEIAYEVGFSDPAYFSRTFSEEFGKSPNAIRK